MDASLPIRQLPCMCVVASPDHRIRLAPAASSTLRENCSAFWIRWSSAGWKSVVNCSRPSASSVAVALLSSFDMLSSPTQRRYCLAASTSGWPHIGPFSSHKLTVKPIGSWTVTASTMKPPASSAAKSEQWLVIGATM